MTDRSKFEQMLEHLVNEETDKAKELFHQLVVEKSREIYETILSEDFNEAKEEDEDEDDLDEAKDEDEEDDVEAETLDGGGRQHPVVGRVLHEFSAAGGTPMRSMAAFWVNAMGTSPTAPTRVARKSCSPRCHTVSSEGEGEA